MDLCDSFLTIFSFTPINKEVFAKYLIIRKDTHAAKVVETVDINVPRSTSQTIPAVSKKNKAMQNVVNNINDEKIKEFDFALNKVLLNLAKRIVLDGEGATKFITVNVKNCKTENDAKKLRAL